MAENKIQRLHWKSFIQVIANMDGWGPIQANWNFFLKVTVRNNKPKILIIEYMLEQIMLTFI